MVSLGPWNGLSTIDRQSIWHTLPRRLVGAARLVAGPNGARELGRRSVVGLALGATALLLSGCLSSGYAYFSHRSSDNTELYFKLPSQWKVFTPTQVIEAANGKLSPTQLSSIEGKQWMMYFTASKKMTLKQVAGGNIATKVAWGEAFANQLSSSERDALSLQAMRARILGADPLQPGSGPFNVLDYSEFTWPGGVRGSRMTVDIIGNGGLVSTFGQVIAVDPQTNWIFGIAISCRASCWGPSTGLIKQVFNSWTVKELAR